MSYNSGFQPVNTGYGYNQGYQQQQVLGTAQMPATYEVKSKPIPAPTTQAVGYAPRVAAVEPLGARMNKSAYHADQYAVNQAKTDADRMNMQIDQQVLKDRNLTTGSRLKGGMHAVTDGLKMATHSVGSEMHRQQANKY